MSKNRWQQNVPSFSHLGKVVLQIIKSVTNGVIVLLVVDLYQLMKLTLSWQEFPLYCYERENTLEIMQASSILIASLPLSRINLLKSYHLESLRGWNICTSMKIVLLHFLWPPPPPSEALLLRSKIFKTSRHFKQPLEPNSQNLKRKICEKKWGLIKVFRFIALNSLRMSFRILTLFFLQLSTSESFRHGNFQSCH